MTNGQRAKLVMMLRGSDNHNKAAYDRDEWGNDIMLPYHFELLIHKHTPVFIDDLGKCHYKNRHKPSSLLSEDDTRILDDILLTKGAEAIAEYQQLWNSLSDEYKTRSKDE